MICLQIQNIDKRELDVDSAGKLLKNIYIYLLYNFISEILKKYLQSTKHNINQLVQL